MRFLNFQIMDFYGASGIPLLWCGFFQVKNKFNVEDRSSVCRLITDTQRKLDPLSHIHTLLLFSLHLISADAHRAAY
jgi:hypothetical protein